MINFRVIFHISHPVFVIFSIFKFEINHVILNIHLTERPLTFVVRGLSCMGLPIYLNRTENVMMIRVD